MGGRKIAKRGSVIVALCAVLAALSAGPAAAKRPATTALPASAPSPAAVTLPFDGVASWVEAEASWFS